MADLVQQKLQDLLSKAQSAHHDFEATELEGKFDEQWAAWYAEYLIENGIAGLFGAEPDPDTLAARLHEISQRHKAERTATAWAEYTARELLNNLTSN